MITRRNVISLAIALPVLAAFGRSFAAAAPLKIGIIGAGRMGSGLGTLLIKAGHEVMFSSRHPEELKSLVEGLGSRASAGSVADAMKFGDVIFLTVPYNAMPDLARDYGKTLAAKPLIVDVANPSAARDGEPGKLAMEQGPGPYLAALMPGAKIVRAFNAIGFGKLAEFSARTGDTVVAAPIAGDDRSAVALAEKLIREMGFEPVLIGGLAMSKHTLPREPLGGEHTPAEARKIAAELK
jgi:predicted dinucleotide-binding enzyme